MTVKLSRALIPAVQTDSSTPFHAYISFGSNLGDSLSTLRAARKELCAAVGIKCRALSPLYESHPCGGPPGQGLYLNGVLAIETDLTPLQLLHLLQRIEDAHGRVRSERWGERTLDLDLLLYNNLILDGEELILPHPRMHERAFVLFPLAEIAPEVIHPLYQKSMRELSQELELTGIWQTTQRW